jgi:hypothetical protein
MIYDEYLEFDIRIVGDFKNDKEYVKSYEEYLGNLKDHSYNVQEVEI